MPPRPASLAAGLPLAVLMAMLGAAAAGQRGTQADLPLTCRGEWQLVMCSEISPSDTRKLQDCCQMHRNRPAAPRTAAAMQQGQDVARPDLEGGAGPGGALDWHFGQCTARRFAEVPVFSRGDDGETTVALEKQPVPDLPRDLIRRIKTTALLATPEGPRSTMRRLQQAAGARRSNSSRASGFKHPGGYAGSGELALMQERLAANAPLQAAAKETLLTGRGVPVSYTRSGWAPPTGTPAGGYGGPLPMERVLTDWGGWAKERAETCPHNYPSNAPLTMCGHVSFVEMDASMSYKSALAYVATGDERYALQAMGAVQAWAKTNVVFGLEDRNGPLEAAWGCSAMARTMDLLRATWPGFQPAHLSSFLAWVNRVLMPQMDYYLDVLNPGLLKGKAKRVLTYGNWPSTIADAMMAVGVLADDKPRYNKGLALFKATVEGYFKWGRGQWAKGRIVGESTETLRDVYHTLFGLGSLIQAAETAWGQDTDVYSEERYVLAAAMELHARIINAYEAGDEAALPPGFKFFESMPKAPDGCAWSWDINTQLWSSYDKQTKQKCSELRDGKKYLLGIKYLPNGFEIGYNHFAGRLGMKLPETASLLRRHPVDWYAFCWGLATLTHADTARELWRTGVTKRALCGGRGKPRPS